jgi:hypothetical protein
MSQPCSPRRRSRSIASNLSIQEVDACVLFEARKKPMTAAIFAHGESNQVRTRPLVTWLLAIFVFLTVVYLGLHCVLPPSDEGAFFWNDAPAQWLDWLFWSGTGVFLYLSSTLAGRSVDPHRSVISFPPTVRSCFSEMLKSLVVALIVVWVAVNAVDVDVVGLKIKLKEAPAIAVLLAFVFGFYPRVTRVLLFKVVLQFLKRIIERVLGRSIGDSTDEAYVELHVDPRLQRAYLLAASTKEGRPGHEKSRDKRVSYKVSNIVSQAGFTVNALRMVFIAQDLMPLDKNSNLVAHEASHVEQGFWSDSLEQEVEAYRTAAEVMKELKERGDIDVEDADPGGWSRLSQKAAEDKVRDMKSLAPLYGMIPRKQKRGGADRRELIRQGVCLGLDMLGCSRQCMEEGGSE